MLPRLACPLCRAEHRVRLGPSGLWTLTSHWDTIRRTGLGRSTIYRLVARKQFPMPVRLTSRAVGWREVDIARWSASLEPAAR